MGETFYRIIHTNKNENGWFVINWDFEDLESPAEVVRLAGFDNWKIYECTRENGKVKYDKSPKMQNVLIAEQKKVTQENMIWEDPNNLCLD